MNHKNNLLLAAALCGLCGVADPVFAREGAVFQLEGITVEGERHRGRDVMKYKEKEEKIPYAYSVLDETDLDNHHAGSLKDSLNYTAGVVGTIVDEALFHNSTIRGFEVNHTDVTLNGMKMFGGNDRGTGYSSGIDTLYSPEMKGLESVTIVKGAASVHHGAASPGGSIDLQLKRAELASFGKGNIEIGSRKKREMSFDVNHLLTDHSAFRVTLVHRNHNLPTDESDTERWYIAPTYHYEKKGKTEIDFFSYWQKDTIRGSEEPLKEKIPAFAANSKDPLYQVPNRLFWGIPGVDGMDLENKYLGYSWDQTLSDRWHFHQNVAYMDADADFRKTGVIQAGKSLFLRDFMDTKLVANSFSADSYFSYEKEGEENHHHFLMGLDVHRQSWEFHTKEKLLPMWQLNHLLQGNIDRGIIDDKTEWDSHISKRNTSWEKALYVQDVYEQGKITWNGGFRHTRYTTGLDKEKVTTLANTWQTGISYDHGHGWHSYANHATSFKPNNGMYTPDYKEVGPTRGVQSEIGLKYDSPHRHLHGTLSLFHIEKQNYPVGLQKPKGFYTPVDQMISKGVEIEVHSEVNENLEMTATYTYADRIYKGLKPGITSIYLGGVPKHAVTLWLDTETEEREEARWNGGLGLRFLGKRWADDKIHTLSPVLLVDASLRYRNGNHSLRLDGKNLFNTHYYTAVRFTDHVYTGFVGDQRQISLTYEYKW